MYSVTVRHHIMIAHSLPRPYFGPAAGLHGATFVIDAELRSVELNEHNVVIDIGHAHHVLGEVVSELNYKNLDDYPPMAGALTTTEYLARSIHEQVTKRLQGFRGILKITLHESHVASAAYEAEIA
jgi:6-pyruvoyltetrahydropterin/6-carboxytetrahydropterin synthase